MGFYKDNIVEVNLKGKKVKLSKPDAERLGLIKTEKKEDKK